MIGAAQNLVAASEIERSGRKRVEGQGTERIAGSNRGPGIAAIRAAHQSETAGRENHVRSGRIDPDTPHADGAIRLRRDAVVDRGPGEPSVEAPLYADGGGSGVEGSRNSWMHGEAKDAYR